MGPDHVWGHVSSNGTSIASVNDFVDSCTSMGGSQVLMLDKTRTTAKALVLEVNGTSFKGAPVIQT